MYGVKASVYKGLRRRATVYYPIWWGEAPKIIHTFLESHSFDGKTIVPFCTSGSSGIGSSAYNLHVLTSENTKWLPGARLDSSITKEEMADWLDSLEIRNK